MPATRPPVFLLPALVALPLGALWPRGAVAYHEDMHHFIARQALRGAGLEQRAEPIPPGAPAALRAVLSALARSDPALGPQWQKRYPTAESFDAWALKELLLLEPSAQVFGIDRIGAPQQTLLEIVALGAREPDDDRRNRDRRGYDAQRKPLRDARDQPVPADPALLNMGRLGALSSQAHAHYGLAQVALADDPEVLKTDPRRFAVAAGSPRGPILTLAAEMAQAHLDLALLAALLPEGASPELSMNYTGQAFHYLQDVSNQIHTVQVGLYDFFVDAFKARLQMAALSGGGYFGPLRSLASIGIDILTNHHGLAEALTRKRVLEALAGKPSPPAARLVAAAAEDEPDFGRQLDEALAALGSAPERGEFGLAITRAVIEASSREGAEVYRTTRAIASPRLRQAGEHFGDNDDPDRDVVPPGPETERAYAEYFALQERAFRRCGTAMRRWLALQRKLLDGLRTEEARAEVRAHVAGRLLRRQLSLLGEAEARRQDYLRMPPEEAAPPERMPAMLAAEGAVLALVVGLLVRAMVRRRRATA